MLTSWQLTLVLLAVAVDPLTEAAHWEQYLALRKNTSQSSNVSPTEGGSEKAVDTTWYLVDYYEGSCTQTSRESDPWWMVDLGANYEVRDVTIQARIDCCGELLNGAVVTIMYAPNGTGQTCGQSLQGMQHRHFRTVWCNKGIRGRYVKVHLNGPNRTLTLCNVNVIGKLITDQCQSNPCRNGALCEKIDDDSYKCNCTMGFDGYNCEVAFPCRSDPCQNGGTCGKADDDSYTCNCTAGYSGENCGNAIPCHSDPCRNGATCQKSDDDSYTCNCKTGFTGQNCENAIPCHSDPCRNGATCQKSDDDSYTCNCKTGFTGQNCETIAPCLSDPCQNGATCHTTNGDKYTCHCKAGYNGQNCETADPCLRDPCLNGATCQNTGDVTYQCNCKLGYTGQNCETAVPCLSNPCLNGATCQKISDGSYQCNCTTRYTGKNCENEEKCVDIWSIIKRTGVYGTKQWHGNFSMARCISRCLRNSSCLAVDYNQDIGECYHLDNSTHLPSRIKMEHLTLITKESRCPRPECTDPVPACKNGGTCTQHSTGNGDITCQCAPGYKGTYCESE
ncbi:hypothetical protein LSAT2_008547 [Lamellibrachia satsuma]|nr:hypothetical protein LSAT2_008547 [Lamellibrachia satsuma]